MAIGLYRGRVGFWGLSGYWIGSVSSLLTITILNQKFDIGFEDNTTVGLIIFGVGAAISALFMVAGAIFEIVLHKKRSRIYNDAEQQKVKRMRIGETIFLLLLNLIATVLMAVMLLT